MSSSKWRRAIALPAMLLVAGCTNDVAQHVALPSDHSLDATRAVYARSLTVGRVTGGSSRINQDGITSEEFRDALEYSLKSNDLYENIPSSAKYRINADIYFDYHSQLKLYLPDTTQEIDAKILYSIVSTATDQEIFHTTIFSSSINQADLSHDITLNDNLVSIHKNWQNSYQAAAQKNIALFLTQMAQGAGVGTPTSNGPTASETLQGRAGQPDVIRCEHRDGSIEMRDRASCLSAGGTAIERVQ
jgi:hypothetical protein